MKKYLKSFCVLLILLFSFSKIFASEIPLLSATENSNQKVKNQLSIEDKKNLENFLKLLKNPNKMQVLIDTISNKNNLNNSTPKSQEYINDDISDNFSEILNLAQKKYYKLGVYETAKQYYKEFKNDLLTIDYISLIILIAFVIIGIFVLFLIEYFYSKFYNIDNYTKDFLKYYKRNNLIKAHILLFFINIRFFLPSILPATLLVIVGKVNSTIIYEWILNLFIFTIILMLLLKFLQIIFFKMKHFTLYRFKNWVFLSLWNVFIFLALQYIFSEMKDYALIKLNMAIFVLIGLVLFIRLLILLQKKHHQSLKQQIRNYTRLFLHIKKYSITLLYIGIYSYIISILFLEPSLTKFIIVRSLFIIIGVLFIYLFQSYFEKIFIKNFMIKKSIISENISQMIFSNTTSRNSSEFSFFWRFFNIFYYMVFILIYIIFLSIVLEINLFAILNEVSSYKIVSVLLNVLLNFSILIIITFIIVILIEKYLLKLSKQGDIIQLKKRLTLYKILQKPYQILFFTILLISSLSALDISLTTLLASTGVVTIFLAFGMKDILQNFFNSIMFFLEDSFSLNDYIDLGGFKGTIEEISMVHIKIRDAEGNLIMVPFREIKTIVNYSKDYSYAVVEVGVSYNTDIDKVFKVLLEISEELRKDKAVKNLILAPLETIGVSSLSDSSVNVKCKIKTKPGKQFFVKSLFLRKIYEKFTKEDIDFHSHKETKIIAYKPKFTKESIIDTPDKK